jgi:23S rRNA (guanine745-N1)-methyltransferase
MGIAQVVDLLACPYCADRLALSGDGRGVACGQGHRFDLARQGYLNLLAGPQPPNADTAQMIDARTRFLAAGLFDPIAVAAGVLAAGSSHILDAGAGTGRLLASLLDTHLDARGVALDVSTAAARRAAGAHPRLGAVVADVWRKIPAVDGAFDLVVSNFAPRHPAEFFRVLAPGGRLLTITPTADHLIELRSAYGLLDIPPAKADRLAETLTGRFTPEHTEAVRRRDHWTSRLIADAIAMGPNAFHTRDDRPEPAPADVTISVELCLWSRI